MNLPNSGFDETIKGILNKNAKGVPADKEEGHDNPLIDPKAVREVFRKAGIILLKAIDGIGTN